MTAYGQWADPVPHLATVLLTSGLFVLALLALILATSAALHDDEPDNES